MTRVARVGEAVGSGSALVLLAVVATLLANWPDRSTDANLAWYAVARVRATGILLLAGWVGASDLGASPRQRAMALTEPLAAAVLSAPIEALAYFGSVPAASLAWSVAAPLPLALAAFGVSWAIAVTLRRVRLGWSLPLILPAVAVGLVMLDVRIGPVLWIPWLLPFAPSWPAAALLFGVSAVTVTVLVRSTTRREDAA